MTTAFRCPRGVAVGSGVGVGVCVGVGVGCGVGVFVDVEAAKRVGSSVAVGCGPGSTPAQATTSGRHNTRLQTAKNSVFHLVVPCSSLSLQPISAAL
jgi:hypothetical protein